MRTTKEIRASFLDFFSSNNHIIVPSGSLVPKNDPTLLFTNAGMNQFKDVFLGNEQRDYTRATSVQRCVRAGGKHNDLENVGHTARHHTFFEMLGNFSFGDYFKKEAIFFSWEYLTKVLAIPEDRLWITVFRDDDEAADIWIKQVGIDPQRFSRCDEKDNFWSMGDTGPCGPCSEIFYDHGSEIPGGPPGSPEADADRYIEIWNLVFMQYDRDSSGTLHPLPKPSVDTGMGLERLAAVLQGVHTNYDTDIFQSLIHHAANLASVKYGNNPQADGSLRVLSDHIRSTSFLIADGVMPSNEGRGYVLRRIIRRAVHHGHKIGLHEPFFAKLVDPLCTLMGEAYPILVESKNDVEKILQLEEERFLETLETGLNHLETSIGKLQENIIPGEIAFKLYDTYGFPLDLTTDIARERGLQVDQEGFDLAMKEQRERSRAAWSGSGEVKTARVFHDIRANLSENEFIGYERLDTQAEVVALVYAGERVESLKEGQTGAVILDRTSFYGESGGQMGDTGALLWDQGKFAVTDTQKPLPGLIVHEGKLEQGELYIGSILTAHVDKQARFATAYNHSATHLLHSALKQVLGEHVNQMGSLVGPDRLRFDFQHFTPMTVEEVKKVEDLVNAQIRANADADIQVMSLDAARESGAQALFGEKYGDAVRVVRIGFSLELCGGTHVSRAGDIGVFKILSESGIASGVRRIEGATGRNAMQAFREDEEKLTRMASLLKTSPTDALLRLENFLENHRKMEKELQQLKAQQANQAGEGLATRAKKLGEVSLLVENLEDTDAKSLREVLDRLKETLGSCIVVLATAQEDKVSLIAGVSKDLTKTIKAGELINVVAEPLGGRGGGRPDMAQAGAKNPEKLPEALALVEGWVKEKLA